MNDVMRDLKQLATELLSRDSDSDADEDVTTWQWWLTNETVPPDFDSLNTIPITAQQRGLNSVKEDAGSAFCALCLWLSQLAPGGH